MTKETEKSKNVYQCIAEVQAALAIDGISKDKKNDQQGYKFRGIDDIYNALAGLLSKSGLCILPRVLDKAVVERATKSGGVLFYTTVDVEFDFVSAHDSSKHVVKVLGEAMDSGDKSTNKAMSAAYKYACLQTFCIPTEGETKDSEESTHENIISKSVFKNAALRKTFCENVISSYQDCLILDELRTITELNKEKVDAMKASGNDHDAMAVDEIRKQYVLAMQRINASKTVNDELAERQAAFSDGVRGMA